jgi:FtsP/CotA-like multicopper oxidase with cupredoxin domain
MGFGAAVLVVALSGCSSSHSKSPAAGASGGGAGRERVFFLAAEEVPWNYAPTGRDGITGKPFDDTANVFVHAGPDRIGSTYTKCLYRGYTDATFKQRAPLAAADAYLGMLGPVIRAEVGDTIVVTFRNTCSFPASVHPHGVFYDKDSEGTPYADGTSGKDTADDLVAKSATHVYHWQVPERAGPGPMDGSSVMWMYHSHSDEVRDTYSGLMGPMVVTAAGKARDDGSPTDVDREVFALFSVMDENQSIYIDREIDRLSEPDGLVDDEDFGESNLMHSVNGYVYGNQPMITVEKGERVRWYVMAMGTEVDLHTPHWHGNTVVANGMRTDTVSLLPATMITADMVPDDPGIWLFHCHVNDHILAGMSTRYEVTG